MLQSLGYVGIATDKLEDWSGFATGLLGMQVVERGRTGLALRMDDRKQRLLVDRDSRNGCNFFGWEVADAPALDAVGADLEKKGVAVVREPRALADQRCVTDLISFHDPMRNRFEIFHGPLLAETPFAPGRCISGFRTGPLGLGHVVLTTDSIERAMPFYQDVLGFRLSDYTLKPFKAYFFHINPRHHSLAMVETGKNGIHHLMVELFSLDDVGQGYDIAQGDPERVAVTLGRHTNDLMTSFYAHSPSGFMMEYGWGGQDIDPQTWQPFECDYGPSLWGHDRSWLSPEARAKARELRLHAAATGHRAPVQVMDGNYNVMRGACAWWDQAKG
jgi:2,3-dihydroxybiphenyl 1,2-dioxygenase